MCVYACVCVRVYNICVCVRVLYGRYDEELILDLLNKLIDLFSLFRFIPQSSLPISMISQVQVLFFCYTPPLLLTPSQGLADATVVAKLNGSTLWDMDRPLEESCSIELLKFDSEDGNHVFWHSSAHILGQAMERCNWG